jgi:hypothetical protein
MSTDGFQKDTTKELINSIMTCFFAVYIASFPALVFAFLSNCKEKLKDEAFKEKFESLYLNIDVETEHSLYLTTLFATRRLFFSVLVIFLPNTCAQLLVVLLTSLGTISFILSVKPF